MFYIGTFSTLLTGVWLLIEHAVSSEEGSKLRLLTISGNQFLFCVLCGLANLVALTFKTIAYQNERPGLITMIGYIGILYGFLVDTFWLKE